MAETGHLPGKHTKQNNWCRYQRKRMMAGLVPDEQMVLFEKMAASRSGQLHYQRNDSKKTLNENSKIPAYFRST